MNKKKLPGQVLAKGHNPSTWEAEMGGSCMKPAGAKSYSTNNLAS
jgi:hypothetical protein